MKYLELKEKHQKAINDFPMFFAFNNDQLREGIAKLGANKTELLNIGGGGFIRKTDSEAFDALWENIDKERAEARKDDEYLVEMFRYELNNHEYCYTWDLTDTLNSLDLTMEEINSNAKMKIALMKAVEICRDEDQEVQ
jgi:hypothetical protein